MDVNKIIDDTIPNKCDESNGINDIQDNLNTSLTSLTLNESPIEEISQNEDDAQKEVETTKVVSLPLRIIPCHNVPEKIVLCLDTCTDLDFTPFKIGDGSTFAPLYMLKRIIDIFVQNKNFIDSRHEFSLIILDSSEIRWVKDFTNNPSDIINALKDISECEPSEDFHLNKLLDAIWQNVNIPKPNHSLQIPPSYVVRLILLYSRSSSSPITKENYNELLNNPYFTVDVIMTHEETPIDKYQEIFNCIQKLDDKPYSYKFEVGRNVTMLHDCMAKLLSHPLQRPTQKLASYEVSPESQKRKSE